MEEKDHKNGLVAPDSDDGLRPFTQARIALGSVGESMPLAASFSLKMAHAFARTAIYSSLDTEMLLQCLEKFGLQHWQLHSQAAERYIYLQRPDLGRKLNAQSEMQLREFDAARSDVAIVLADGLSATAVNEHSLPLLSILLPALSSAGFSLLHIVLAEQARVAIGDEIGSLLNAKLVLVLIGERPGLSSPHSMGAYVTYDPKPGLTDEMRNCVSNIHAQGLGYDVAAKKIFYLVTESLKRRVSGIDLKDDQG